MFSTADEFRHIKLDSSVVLDEQQLKALQNTLFEILLDMKKVLDDGNYDYVLCGGSALGAVRHKGFIPWDDDIDIMIPRKDYDNFLKDMENKFQDKYWIHVPGKTDDYALLLSHIRLKGTSVKTRDDLNTNECGASIDVFPIENTYSNPVRRLIHGIGCMYFGFMVSSRKFYRDRKLLKEITKKSESTKLKFSTNLKFFIGALASGFSVNKWVKDADKWNSRCKDNNSRFITVPSGREHFFNSLHERSNILPGREMTFNEVEFKCPNKTDIYLQRLYGNYNIIPDESKREKHIYFEPFDLGKNT